MNLLISIFIPDVVEKDVEKEDNLWMEASKKNFLAAYDEGDAIYDKL